MALVPSMSSSDSSELDYPLGRSEAFRARGNNFIRYNIVIAFCYIEIDSQFLSHTSSGYLDCLASYRDNVSIGNTQISVSADGS